MLRSISDAVQNLMSLEEPGIYGMAQLRVIVTNNCLQSRSAFSHPFADNSASCL